MPRIYVSFSAEIVPKTMETLIVVMAEQANKGVDEVYFNAFNPWRIGNEWIKPL
ncbi:MAG: hypothetical protein QW835_00380 [Candidatus Hadarchaeum sp.]